MRAWHVGATLNAGIGFSRLNVVQFKLELGARFWVRGVLRLQPATQNFFERLRENRIRVL